MRLSILIALAAIFTCAGAFAQGEPIILTNPSFEDMPRHSKAPRGWHDCGFEGESPPDVQPSGTFSVTHPPQEGDTYLGMVVRDNDTWESVSQRLSRPMQAGQCYQFSIHLARSELYVSTSRVTDRTANYTTPAKFRIYGGFGHCDKQYLLAETKVIINNRWLEYNFKFEPIDNYSYIILEVFFKTPTLFPYNGNVLVDNASPIVPIPCDEEPQMALKEPEPEETAAPPVTAPEPAPQTQVKSPEVARADTPPAPPKVENTPPQATEEEPGKEEEPVSFAKLDRAELREGQTIRIDKLFFEADKWVITENSYEVLNDVYQFLNKNDDVIIEVGGHTNGLCTESYCDKLSEQRARAVAIYLAQRGIPWDRLEFKGYGKRKPIASNDSLEGRRLNQRVEIKILGFNG
jgi:outer membrane protein OmpA-like peptidoglycan-associated protein